MADAKRGTPKIAERFFEEEHTQKLEAPACMGGWSPLFAVPLSWGLSESQHLIAGVVFALVACRNEQPS